MKKIILFIVCFFSFLGCLNAEELVYKDYSVPTQYYTFYGSEFPGTEADFRWEKAGYNSDGCLAIDYDFHETGRYCQVCYNYPISENETGISFMAKGLQNAGILVRLSDKNNETYQTNIAINTSDWKKYTINFADLEKEGHWGGDANNKIDFPISSISFGPTKMGVTKGVLYIDNFAFLSNNVEKLKQSFFGNIVEKCNFVLDTNKPGNLFYLQDDLKGKIVVKGYDLPNFNATVDLVYKDGFGKEINAALKKIVLKDLSSDVIDLPKIKGVCEIEYTANIGGAIKKGIISYAVVPDNSKIALGKTSYFGVNTHFNGGWYPYLGKIIKRAGISWIRDGEADLNDRANVIAKENGLEYMPCFTNMQTKSLNYIKEELANGKTYKDKWDFSPYIQEYGEYAKKYGDFVNVYDMLNEPNNVGWPAAIGGYWAGGPWIGVFYQWSTQISDFVRKNDANSNASILWEDMEHWQWSQEYINYGVNKEVDYISPHPYNLNRKIPLPEKQITLNTYNKFFQRNKAAGRDWKVIVGEVGFSSFELTENTPGGADGYYSPCNRSMQAAYLVRMMIMHLTAGVERIFWYDLTNDGFKPDFQEQNFGLVYNDGTPKPAIVAYSNLINQCEGAKWLGKVEYPDTYIYAFTNRDNKKVFCGWVIDGEKNIVIDTNKKAKIVDIFGNETMLSPVNGKLNIKLCKYPIYILDLDDFYINR